MAVLNSGRAFFRIVLLALLPLTISACSSVRPAGRPPENTAFFVAPVFSGDTITTFAERYGVAKEELLALNNIRDRNRRLAMGYLRVPTSALPREARAAAPAVAPAAGAVDALIERSVQPGAMAPQPAVLQPRSPSIERRSLEPLPAPSARRTSLIPESRRAAPPPAPVTPAPRSAPAQGSADEANWDDGLALLPAEPPTPSQRFLWPLEGRVISPFGDNGEGGRNDGINIAAPRGTPVHAAEAGEISYVGNELKGYGNLILIRHENGFVTAYAHTDGVLVKRGDRVERGQAIASTGETGEVSQPQLHFELRQGTQPLDPTRFLVAPVADSRDRFAEETR